MKNTALLLIDFQNDYFLHTKAKWPLSETEKAAEKGIVIISFQRQPTSCGSCTS